MLASELGSGLYDLGGRSLQVYRFVPDWRWREVTPGRPGARFVLPVTFGFLDFTPFDIPGDGLPSRLDSYSITPGIELDFAVRDDWTLTAWGRAGFAYSGGGVDGWLYATGFALHRTSRWKDLDVVRRHEIALAGAHYDQGLPDDGFLRVRNAAELLQETRVKWRDRELMLGAYGILDVLPDPPTAPGSERDSEPVRVEMGVMLGTRPALRYRRFALPRLGLGYRFAGAYSGWHLAIGGPF